MDSCYENNFHPSSSFYLEIYLMDRHVLTKGKKTKNTCLSYGLDRPDKRCQQRSGPNSRK